MDTNTTVISTELTNGMALALAQFVKRIGWSEIRVNAVDNDEAYVIRDAIDQLRKSLENAGFSPR